MTGTPETSPPSSQPPADPGEKLAAKMADAWRRGECLPVEDYLHRHPELFDPPEGAVRLIYEEVCLRQERGEEVAAEELLRRFPHWASELSVMLDCHRLVQARFTPPQFPAAGESLGDFFLVAELGRGIHGRVFLAMQPTLADRLVVLKVTPRQDREFLSLARLQHTHIIPLYGVHDFPTRNLRALCQPYLGGATLARLLDLLRAVPAVRRTGHALIDALDRAGAESPFPLPGHGGPRDTLAWVPYVEAVCWVGACLADALQFAHERGLLHLDLKPSNVLLATDGQPLLLDFHLALHPLPVGQAAPEGLGGTPEYMSPEQCAAYAAAQRGQPVPTAVDRRSDVYSLGRLLYIALGGEGEADGLGPPPLRHCNSCVSVGLADVINRCLAPDPADRYADAATLAADLRRHLADLPLRGVPNRSLRERWGKWRRRRPYALLWAGLLLALTAVPAVLGTVALERLRDAREALREGQEQMQRRAYSEAARTLARGKARADGVPGGRRLAGELDDELRRARRANAAGQLHTVCERLRLLSGADVLPERDLRALQAHCRTAWDARDLVAGRADAALDVTTEEQVRADLLDLALLWTDLNRRLTPGETGRAEALRVLAEAEALCGPSAAVALERRALDGVADPEVGPAARTFREHAALGRALLRLGEPDRAAAELERASDLRPQDFWTHFFGGVCAHRRGRYPDAVHSFSVAIALAPEFAAVYHNRALAHSGGGQTAAALRDYDRALALDPALAAAAVNRGLLHYQEGRYPEALADLEHALRQGADSAATHYNLSLVHLARGQRCAARRSLEQALHYTPAHPEARALARRLRSEE